MSCIRTCPVWRSSDSSSSLGSGPGSSGGGSSNLPSMLDVLMAAAQCGAAQLKQQCLQRMQRTSGDYKSYSALSCPDVQAQLLSALGAEEALALVSQHAASLANRCKSKEEWQTAEQQAAAAHLDRLREQHQEQLRRERRCRDKVLAAWVAELQAALSKCRNRGGLLYPSLQKMADGVHRQARGAGYSGPHLPPSKLKLRAGAGGGEE